MPWNDMLPNLRDILAELYPTVQDSRVVVNDAGLDQRYISFDPRAVNNWFSILDEARKRKKVQAIVDIAYGGYPENEWLRLAHEGHLTAIRGPDIGNNIKWQNPLDNDNLEKLTGKRSTLLPIRFLEIGLLRSRCVARIVRSDGAAGSGFLIDNNLLITNHHVLPDKEAARTAQVQFNYQETSQGLNAPTSNFGTMPDDLFVTSPMDRDDWTAVRLQGNPNQEWGALTLSRVDLRVEDFVNIIQHPGGGPKHIAMYHNVVVFVGNNRVQYLTDTLPGSSGSPVFDSQWNVVALHHSGGWLTDPGTKQKYFRNEGIQIDAIIDGLVSAGIYPFPQTS